MHPNVVDFQNQSMQMTEMRNQKNQLANAVMNQGQSARLVTKKYSNQKLQLNQKGSNRDLLDHR